MRTTDHLTERYGRGSWAIVTGGSDGIGLEMGKELARKHFNVILIARNPAKLQTASKSIGEINSKIQVKTIEFDFTSSIKAEDY
jgi:17beta-estradiol 17-dehydrogenase / very-long-chain 3-oxoacyl-CoA reductase